MATESREKLEQLSIPALENKLRQIDTLRGVRAKMMQGTRELIEEIICNKRTPTQKEVKEKDPALEIKQSYVNALKSILPSMPPDLHDAVEHLTQSFNKANCSMATDGRIRIQADSKALNIVVTSTNHSQGFITYFNGVPPTFGTLTISPSEISTEKWKAIALSTSLLEYGLHSRIIGGMQSGIQNQQENLRRAKLAIMDGISSERMEKLAKEYMSKYKNSPKTNQEIMTEMLHNPEDILSFARVCDRLITRIPPQSETEAKSRLLSYVEYLGCILMQRNTAHIGKREYYNINLSISSKAYFDTSTQFIAPTNLAVIDTAQANNLTEEESKKCEYVQEGNAIYFVVPKEAVSADSHLQQFIESDEEKTLDRLVALHNEYDKKIEGERGKWLSGKLPSVEKLQMDKIKAEMQQELEKANKRKAELEGSGSITPVEASVWDEMTSKLENAQWDEFHSSAKLTINDALTTLNTDQRRDYAEKYPLHIIGTKENISTLKDIIFITNEKKISIDMAECTPQWRIHKLLQAIFISLFPKAAWTHASSAIDRIYPFKNAKNLHSDVLTYETLKDNPALFVQTCQRIWKHILRQLPASTQEAESRIITAGASFLKQALSTNQSELEQCITIAAENFMALKPLAITPNAEEEPELHEVLSVLDEELLISADITFAKVQDKLHFVCRKENIPKSLERYKHTDNEDTLDLVVNLHLQEEDALETNAWASGTLPNIEQMENDLFETDIVTQKFLPHKNESADKEESEEKEGSGQADKEDSGVQNERYPRLKALRDLLLRNGIRAKFTLDERTFKPQTHQYRDAEEGHYVAVTIPDANLQVIISDDASKGTYIVYNVIDPEHYTEVTTKELKDKFGASSHQRFHKRSQFMHGLQTTIQQQIKEPLKIYPIGMEKSSLSAFSPEIISALKRDFELVKEKAKKEDIGDLGISDFMNIESGDALWSFGGVACGTTYLDRLARELGLNGYWLDQPQHVYRERILHLVQWELSEKFRSERETVYQKASDAGRAHNLKDRTRKKKLQSAEPEAEEVNAQ